jgi:rubrerythrin
MEVMEKPFESMLLQAGGFLKEEKIKEQISQYASLGNYHPTGATHFILTNSTKFHEIARSNTVAESVNKKTMGGVMIYCSKCGHKIEIEAIYCPKCGNLLEQETVKQEILIAREQDQMNNTCPHCGYSWQARAKKPKCCPLCKRYLNRSRYQDSKEEENQL